MSEPTPRRRRSDQEISDRREGGHPTRRRSDQDIEESDSLSLGWGDKALKARGVVIVIIVVIVIANGLTIYADNVQHQHLLGLLRNAETERRLLEQEARLEVQMIRANQDLIRNNISRFCGVTYQGAEDQRALEAWYIRRKEDLERQRGVADEEKVELDRNTKRK